MARTFAITDIHGCAITFQIMIRDVIRLEKEDTLYLLGDYIDRGPDSKGVLDHIITLKEEGFNVRCLRGNHEQFMLDAIYDEEANLSFWLKNGGDAALKSFQVSRPKDISMDYLDFLESLEYYFEDEFGFFVHAGFNFAAEAPFEDQEAMLSIRNFTVDPLQVNGKKVFHGHTPTRFQDIRMKLLQPHAIGISLDNGCVYNTPGFGQLLALELGKNELHIQARIDFV